MQEIDRIEELKDFKNDFLNPVEEDDSRDRLEKKLYFDKKDLEYKQFVELEIYDTKIKIERLQEYLNYLIKK